MLSDDDILQSYYMRKERFLKKAEISLAGHSLFEMWTLQPDSAEPLAGKSVANISISGISTRQYLEVLVKPQRIQQLGEAVFLFLGVNDIVKEEHYSPAQVVAWIEEIVANFRRIASHADYYLLEATPVNEQQCHTVTNWQIQELNAYMQAHVPAGCKWVATFADFAVNQHAYLLDDGLHFSSAGYAWLRQLLSRALVAN